jgi:hypothetical protein
MDSGAIDHITSELDKLTVRDKYSGGEHVHAANIFGMEIKHVGHSTLHSPTSNIHLNHILHVPQAHKSLLSVNHIARDNDVFLEFHPNHFCVKEQQTRRTLLRGPCEGGLYPLKSSSNKPSKNKQALSVIKPMVSLWHHRLGHKSTPVVQQVLSRHNLPFIRDLNKNVVCDACQ